MRNKKITKKERKVQRAADRQRRAAEPPRTTGAPQMIEDMNSERMLYPVREAAYLLGIGRTVVYELMNDGRMRSVRIGQRRLIPKDALDEFVAQLATTEEAA